MDLFFLRTGFWKKIVDLELLLDGSWQHYEKRKSSEWLLCQGLRINKKKKGFDFYLLFFSILTT